LFENGKTLNFLTEKFDKYKGRKRDVHGGSRCFWTGQEPGHQSRYLAQDVLDITTCIFSKKGGEANEEKISRNTRRTYGIFHGNDCIC
jgi:hypothetical protein